MTEQYFFIEDGEYSFRTWICAIKTDADKETVKQALSTYIPYPRDDIPTIIEMRYPQTWDEVVDLLRAQGFLAEWIDCNDKNRINLDYDIPPEKRHNQKV